MKLSTSPNTLAKLAIAITFLVQTNVQDVMASKKHQFEYCRLADPRPALRQHLQNNPGDYSSVCNYIHGSFSDQNISGYNLSGVEIGSTGFYDTIAHNVNFRGAIFIFGIGSGADLTGSDFTNAIFDKYNKKPNRKMSFSNVNFSKVKGLNTVKNINKPYIWFNESDFSGTDLTGIKFETYQFLDTNFVDKDTIMPDGKKWHQSTWKNKMRKNRFGDMEPYFKLKK